MISPFQVRTTDGSPPAKLVASGDNCGFAMYSQHINIVTCHIYASRTAHRAYCKGADMIDICALQPGRIAAAAPSSGLPRFGFNKLPHHSSSYAWKGGAVNCVR